MPGARNGPSFINLYLFSFPCAAVTCQISCAAVLTRSAGPWNRGGCTGNQTQDLPLIPWGHAQLGSAGFPGNRGWGLCSDPHKELPNFHGELHTFANRSDQSCLIVLKTLTELSFIDHRFIIKQESCDQVGRNQWNNPWKCPSSGWMGFGEPWDSGKWNKMNFNLSPNPNHYMIL